MLISFPINIFFFLVDTVYGMDHGSTGVDDGSKAFLSLSDGGDGGRGSGGGGGSSSRDDDILWDTSADLQAMVLVSSVTLVGTVLVLMVFIGFYAFLYDRTDRCLYVPIPGRSRTSDLDDIDCTSSESDLLEPNTCMSSLNADDETNARGLTTTDHDSDWNSHKRGAGGPTRSTPVTRKTAVDGPGPPR